MIRDIILSIQHDLEKLKVDIEKKIDERYMLFQQKKEKGDFCGNCDDGYTRKAFGMDFDESVPNIARTYPAMCQCVSSEKTDAALMALYEKQSELERSAENYQSIRAYISHRLGDDYADKSLDTFEAGSNSQSIISFQRWTEKPETPCFLIGQTGAGKTHLVAHAANTFAAYGRDFIIAKGADIDELTDRDKYISSRREQKIRAMSKVDILIIDDLGVSKMTAARHNEVWYPILDARRNNKRPVLYSSDVFIEPSKPGAPCVWGAYENRDELKRLITRMSWEENGKRNMIIIPLRKGVA